MQLAKNIKKSMSSLAMNKPAEIQGKHKLGKSLSTLWLLKSYYVFITVRKAARRLKHFEDEVAFDKWGKFSISLFKFVQ